MASGKGRVWPLIVGGTLGPFGGSMMHTILPEIGAGLSVSAAQASVGITAYLLPFAVLLMVSGALGARWGYERSVLVGLLFYALGSAVCVLAPNLPIFLIGRAVQGSSNAFTSPLLLTLILLRSPGDRRGRAVGAYISAQAAGQAFAPLIGGAAAAINWRLAFVATGVMALALCLLISRTKGGAAHDGDAVEENGKLDSSRLIVPVLIGAGAAAFLGQFAANALIILGGLVAEFEFGIAPLMRGIMISAFGVTSMMAGPVFGRLADRFGVHKFGPPHFLLIGILAAVGATAPSAPLLISFICLGGVVAAATRMTLTTLAIEGSGPNFGRIMPLIMAAQFMGTATVPVVVTLFSSSAQAAAWVLIGVGALGTAAAVMGSVVSRRRGGLENRE